MSPLARKVRVRLDRSFLTQDWPLVIAIGLLACLPLYLYGVPFIVGDLQHHYRTALGFYESILNGNYYPSWHASTNGGYGDVSVRFYPPMLYFLLCGARMITGDWFFATLLTSVLLTTTGALGMYLWARCFTSHYYSLAAGALFLLSPFHANELYQAGFYGQYAAANILPFVFAFVERIIRGGSRRYVAGLALAWGLVTLFHVPLAVIGSISIATYILIRFSQFFSVASIYRMVAGIGLGTALSCFYWLPVLRELKFKTPSGVGQGPWFDYRNNFLFQHSPSVMGNFLIPLLAAATIALALPATVLIFKKRSEAIAPGVVASLGFLMSTSLSKPIWDHVSILQETQFPWRWLTITSACISLLIAVAGPEIASMWRSRWRPLALVLIGLVAIGTSFTILQLIRGAPLFRRTDFNERVEAQRGSATNKDFLPVWAEGQPRAMTVPVEAGTRDVTIIDWSQEHKAFTLVPGEQTAARLKVYYYPYWVATADGKQLLTQPASDGALLVTVPGDRSRVDVKFTEPSSSYAAAAISLVALLVIVYLLDLTGGLRSYGTPRL
jgi:uncharacterized membrane protein